MLTFKSSSLARKMLYMNLLATGACLLLAGIAFFAFDRITFEQSLIHTLGSQAQIVAFNSGSALLFDDQESARTTLSALDSSPDIVAATLVDAQSRTFAEYRRDASAGGEKILTAVPTGQVQNHWFIHGHLLVGQAIFSNGKKIGSVYLESDLRALTARRRQYFWFATLVLLGCLLAALIASALFRRIFVRPIIQLAGLARTISGEKNYSLRAASANDRTEISMLIDDFNAMLAEIQERDQALSAARSELEMKVTERTGELVTANKDLESFSYSVSHDLRAPLRRIDGFSKILADELGDGISESAKDCLHEVRQGSQHMGQLVDDLLTFSRLGRQGLSKQEVDIKALTVSIVSELDRENADRTIDWRIGELPVVQCDNVLMRQVFRNLLGNAVKFTRNAPTATIEILSREENGEPVFTIRDNGVGFDMKYADKLFGVFQRLHLQEDFEGTGVGLATVRRIIDKHTGHIWVDAAPGRGATFHFTLGAVKESPVEVLQS